jgi:hypothetical protein
MELDGVGAQAADRVDLLGGLHGAEFGGDEGADAAGDHDRDHGRADLAEQRRGRQPAQVLRRPEQAHGVIELHRHHRTDEEPGQGHDRQAFHAHVVKLDDQLAPLEGPARDVEDDLAAEQHHRPQFVQKRTEPGKEQPDQHEGDFEDAAEPAHARTPVKLCRNETAASSVDFRNSSTVPKKRKSPSHNSPTRSAISAMLSRSWLTTIEVV